MTLQELNQYRDLQIEIRSLKEEIANLELPLFSGGDKNGSKPSGVSDPTKQAAFRIIEKKRRLEARVARYEDESDRIEEWLDTIENPEIRAIVRYRFILGYKWRVVTEKVYGRKASKDLAQVNLKRFMIL